MEKRVKMRILVVSDIHANSVALNAIRERFDLCFCLGDLVDYGPDPATCVQWVMDRRCETVRGNHDHGVAHCVDVAGETGFRYLTGVTRPLQWQKLNAEQRKYLAKLPVTKRLEVDGVRYLLVHGTPRDPLDEYLRKDAGAWETVVKDLEADVVCVGHSHMQFELMAGKTRILNPGSVGLPRDGDTRAAYAIIENGKIQLMRVAYDVEKAIGMSDSLPLPDEAKLMYRTCLTNGRLRPPENQPPSQPPPRPAAGPNRPAGIWETQV
jgi:putative phosphoesterase